MADPTPDTAPAGDPAAELSEDELDSVTGGAVRVNVNTGILGNL